MRRILVGVVSLLVAGVLGFAWSQGPDDKDKKDKGFDKKGMGPRFELGKVIPPPLMEILDLTDKQMQQIQVLEKEVKTRLMKILNKDQIKKVQEFKGKGPPDGKEGEKEKGKGKDKKGIPDRPGF